MGTGAAANLPEVKVTATQPPSLPILSSVSTYGSGSNKERTPSHAGFTVQSISYGGGHGAGAEGSFKEFSFTANQHTKDFLYPNEQFGIWEVDLKGGSAGQGASIKFGDGYLLNPDPWKTPSEQVNAINDYDIEATVGYFTASTTSEVTLDASQINYNMFGFGYGFKAKFESPIPIEVGAGFNGTVYSSTVQASYEDSSRTANAFPSHPISKAFNARAAVRGKTKILD